MVLYFPISSLDENLVYANKLFLQHVIIMHELSKTYMLNNNLLNCTLITQTCARVDCRPKSHTARERFT